MEKKINYKKILDKLECVSRIANHQRKRIVDNSKQEKMEILKDAVVVMERYLEEIKGYTAILDKDEHKVRRISWW